MLTEAKIRGAKAAEKPYKLSDAKGLYLLIQPTGSRWWRLKYRYGGKERSLSLGVYPTIWAHVVQGWEVLILSTVAAHFGNQIVLLEHDGWTARKSLATPESIASMIYRQTGWRVCIEHERLALPPVLSP